VVQDLLGGDLLMADVHEADETWQGVHYWNRLADDVELDLTREQFRRGETVGEPRGVERPRDVTRGRLPGQYHLLAARVARGLAGAAPEPRAVTVEAVCRQIDGRVLLCRNHRDEWELPGGRPEVGELFSDCVRRELRAQTGVDVTVDDVLGVRALEVLPGTWIDVVAYECLALGDSLTDGVRPSAEHAAVAFLEASTLDAHELAPVYEQLIAGGVSHRSLAPNPSGAPVAGL
jgi:ADP-ribose pyrophosphatase YjhB (NUDIX family)